MKKHLQRLAQSKTVTRVILPIVLVIILAFIGYSSFQKPAANGGSETKSGGIFNKSKNLKMDEAKTASETFINDFLMSSGSKATVTEITEDYGLYKVKVDIGSEVVDSYLTKDGKLFFPQAFDVAAMQADKNGGASAGNQAAPKAATDLPKSDKPVVELFVMSQCPYGTQIEKGILPVVEALGKKIDFKIKFVDYAMHGEVELNEQMNQYCIDKTQPEKFNTYLKCFLVEGKTADCLKSTGINTAKVDSCVKETDAKYKITENFKNKVGFKGSYAGFDIYKDDNAKYGVQGSPTLVINGETAESGRDSATLLETICSTFKSRPKECDISLSGDTPAAGFGTGSQTSTTGGTAACQ